MGYPWIYRDKSSKLGYPRSCWDILGYLRICWHMLCKFLQTCSGKTQDNRVANAACQVPALAAPSPSLRQSGDMPTWVAVALSAPYSCWKAPSPAIRSEMVCTCLQKATLINSTTLTITWMGLELDSTWGHVDLCERLANLNEGHPFFLIWIWPKIRPTLCTDFEMHKGFGNGALAQSPQTCSKVIWCQWCLVNFGLA